MDNLKRNGLPNRSLMPNRNTTLGSVNNVLQPNRIKKENNLARQMNNDYRNMRKNNIQTGRNNSNLYK